MRAFARLALGRLRVLALQRAANIRLWRKIMVHRVKNLVSTFLRYEHKAQTACNQGMCLSWMTGRSALMAAIVGDHSRTALPKISC